MANPPREAAEKLNEWANRCEEPAVASQPDAWLQEIIRLADTDFQACKTRTHRQSIYAVLVGAFHMYGRQTNLPGEALLSLYQALTNVAGHAKGADELQPEQRYALSPDLEFKRAVLIVGFEKIQDSQDKEKLYRWARAEPGLELTKKKADKLRDNWRQGNLQSVALRRHVTYLEDCSRQGDTWWLPI